MNSIGKYYPAAIATVLLCVLVAVLYPYCKYYVDPDATAYLTIAQRYADGDITKAINGYWSPFSCWLTAIFIKAGWKAFMGAVVTNTIAAIGFMWVSASLFIRFRIKTYFQFALCLAQAVFLSYAVYQQLFADLWECFFLLLSLRLLLSNEYVHHKWMWVLNGAIGALAFFAKAYSFPFFIAHMAGCGFIIHKGWQRESRRQWIQYSLVSISTMILLSLPWIYLLHDKYGIWMTSTAGRLNTSWYLVGHPYFKESIGHLLPPVYANSPYYWEDPYMANGVTPHFWNSPQLFILQVVKAGYNFLKFIISGSEISAFYLLTWLLAVTMMLSKKTRHLWGDKSLLLGFSFVLFPLGFIIINYEARYIWYTLPLSMVVGALALQKMLLHIDRQKIIGNIAIALFAFSYVVHPLWDMRSMVNEGRNEYGLSQVLKENNIQGSFASNLNHAPEVRKAIRLAYFAGCPYYNMPFGADDKELLAEMRRYKVKYYFYWPSTYTDNFAPADEHGQPFKYIEPDEKSSLKIFLINP
ncbi:MAG: hypothetical protein EOP51_15610 [Sphingobacteriales bacterium]|nr:MAG: hypothetical protein EOP51_15610 [Sphingobacteriales bacterium]